MKNNSITGRSRYMVYPVAAFREGEDFDVVHLPVRVERREWHRAAWLFLVLGAFFLALCGIIWLDNRYGPRVPGRDELTGFNFFLLCLAVLFFAASAWAWRRVDALWMDHERIRIRRQGLIGTDTHEAALGEYSGIQTKHRYIEDYEVTSGTTYWRVELVHKEPALCVMLFSRERIEPSDSASGPPPGDRTDWTEHMEGQARRWSEAFGLPLLPPAV